MFNVIKKVLKFSDLSAAATTATATVHTTRGHEYVVGVVMPIDVDFSGGAGSAATIALGITGSTTKYLAATDVFTGVANTDVGSIVGTARGSEAKGTNIIATLTVTGANTSTLTAGQVTVFVIVASLPSRG